MSVDCPRWLRVPAISFFGGILLFASAIVAQAAEVPEDSTGVENPFAQLSWEELAGIQEKLVQHFILATAEIATAQSEMANALELKKQAAIMKAEANALKADSAVDKNRIKSHISLSKKANKKISQALKKKGKLNATQEKKFLQGISHYSLAISQTRELYYEAEPFAQAITKKGAESALSTAEKIKSGRLMELFGTSANKEILKKFVVGLHVAKSIPGLMGSHGKSLKQISTYLSQNNIPVPKSSSDLLAVLDGQEFGGNNWKVRIGNFAENILGGKQNQKCDSEPDLNCLWITVVPGDATIVLPDIRPKYVAGIPMVPKVHRVIAKREGYVTKTINVDLSAGSRKVEISLDKK